MALLIAILTFLVVTIIVLLLWMVFATDKSQDVVLRRMESVRQAERRGGEASLQLKLVRDELLSGIPFIHRLMMRWSWASRFRRFLVQAGMQTKPAKIVLISGVLGLISYLIVRQFYPRFSLVAVIGGLVMATLPFAVVAWKRRRRLHQFEEHFPEALDLLGRAVRAGHAFTTGLEMIAKESAEPIAGEFRVVFEEQNFGLPVRDALLNMAERIPLVDVRFFITALLIQKETGGNLAEILDGLSRVIRDRFRIYREVRTRTAQGKLTAAILIALPIVMFVLLMGINADYERVLLDDPLGPMVLATAAGMQVVGAVFLWKIINIEV